MKKQYYLKDKKINLITHSVTSDYYGNRIATYSYIATGLWAYATQLSQNQVYEAASYGENETRLFVINYRSDLELYDYVEYRGKYYTITRIDTNDDYKSDMFIYVKDTPIGDTPHDIQPVGD